MIKFPPNLVTALHKKLLLFLKPIPSERASNEECGKIIPQVRKIPGKTEIRQIC